MTVVFAGIQLSITRIPSTERPLAAEQERRYQHLLSEIDGQKQEALRHILLTSYGQNA